MLKKIEKFELHHKIVFFLFVILLTIIITRLVIYYVADLNLIVFGLELHHFDYGLIILMITSLLLLFGKNHFKTYLILIAIALGWIIDEMWFVKKSLGHGNPYFYNLSFPYVLLLSVAIPLMILLIKQIHNKFK